MATAQCSCCGEEHDVWDVRPLSCRDDIKVCRWCVGGLRFQFAVPDSTPVFPVRDIGEVAAFYESAGFDTHVYDSGRYGSVEYDGEGVFDLAQLDTLDAGTNNAGCFLLVHNVDAWHAELSDKGVDVGPLADTPWGTREFRLTDPSGNYVRVGRQTSV